MHKFKLFCVAFALALTGCVDTPAPPRQQALSFKQYAPISLDVSDVQIISAYRAPLSPPNVDHLFPTTLSDAIRTWVNDRVRAAGTTRRLEVNILDASVKESALDRTKGIKGAFTNDQAKRYDARIEVEMRIYGTSPLSEASLSVVATRSETIAENASPAVRDALFNRMTAELMAVTNAELEKNFYQYFNQFIIGGI